MKNEIIVLVGSVVVGVIAYNVYQQMRGSKSTARDVHYENTDNNVCTSIEKPETPHKSSDDISDLDSTKASVVSSMRNTREEAKQTIADSLNTIFKETTDDIETENTKALNEISSDLKDLLK